MESSPDPSRPDPSRPDSSHPWQAFHLFYHEDRNRLLREVVAPLVARLGQAGRIDRFFFLRFSVGGPHVRLRLRVLPDREAAVEKALRSAAEDFFDRSPSTRSMPEAEIRELNRQVLAQDPNEREDTVYPDNSVHKVAFEPETERYGGPERLPGSLDLFNASSLEALCFHRDMAERPRSRQLTGGLRILLRQAWGLTGAPDRLLHLAGYAQREWGEWMEPILTRGDRNFAAQEEKLTSMVRRELTELDQGADRSAPGSRGWLAEAARRFAAAIEAVDDATCDRIRWSHLHTTANRLDFSNVEEVYLSRLLTRSLERIAAREAELWEGLGRGRRSSRPPTRSTPESLADLLEPFVTGGQAVSSVGLAGASRS